MLAYAAIGAVACALWGCSASPSKPTAAKTTLIATVDANPDTEGHPAPIVIRIYELKDAGAFSSADYFKLSTREQEVLGASLLGREEFELQPGEARTWEARIAPEVRFLGVAAGFRDLPNSRWKAIVPAPRHKMRTRKLTISVTKFTVGIVLVK
jgi:type VI secretion system protein VasD